MGSRSKTYKQTAQDMGLSGLSRNLYKNAIRMDGQFFTKGLDKTGFEAPGWAYKSSYSQEQRLKRIGHYQLDHGVLLFCNEKAKIYSLPVVQSNEQAIELMKLFKQHGYEDARRQDPWYSGSLHTAFVYGTLDKEIGNSIFKSTLDLKNL